MYMNQVQVLHVYVCTLVSVCVLYNTRAVLAGTAVHTLLMHLVRKQYCLGAYRYEYMYMYYGSSRAYNTPWTIAYAGLCSRRVVRKQAPDSEIESLWPGLCPSHF